MMHLRIILVAGALLVALQCVRTAPLTPGHFEVTSYRSIIDHLLAAPDETTQLCSVRQELEQKEKTQEVVDLLAYLDQEAFKRHGLSCSTDQDLLALSGQVSDSKFELEESTAYGKPDFFFPLDQANLPELNNLEVINSARVLLKKAVTLEAESGPNFESVYNGVITSGEVPCPNCHRENSPSGLSSTYNDADEQATWKFKLAMKVLFVVVIVLASVFFFAALFMFCC